MKQRRIVVSNNDELNTVECPFPLSVIPNNMGINLCSVDNVEWVEQEDGQLVSITINFNPEPAEFQ